MNGESLFRERRVEEGEVRYTGWMLKSSLAARALFPGPLSSPDLRPCRSRTQQSTKCERSIQKALLPQSEWLSLQCAAQPKLLLCSLSSSVPSSKVPGEGTWRKYVKGIDVMRLFSCSPSCLSHYSAQRYKQNNHKNSLTGT